MSTTGKPDDRIWGIAAVAGLFGAVGAGMLNVMWGFGFASTIGFFMLIASVVAVVLAIGWSEPSRMSPPAQVPATHDAPPAPVAAAPSVTVEMHNPVPHAEADHVAAAPAPAVVHEGPGLRPTALEAPREGKADDLKQIKGIGPALEKLCHSLGFYHFDQVANWTADEVAWVDQNLEGFKGRVTRDNWVAQARTLAAGGSTDFSRKVDQGEVY